MFARSSSRLACSAGLLVLISLSWTFYIAQSEDLDRKTSQNFDSLLIPKLLVVACIFLNSYKEFDLNRGWALSGVNDVIGLANQNLLQVSTANEKTEKSQLDLQSHVNQTW